MRSRPSKYRHSYERVLAGRLNAFPKLTLLLLFKEAVSPTVSLRESLKLVLLACGEFNEDRCSDH